MADKIHYLTIRTQNEGRQLLNQREQIYFNLFKKKIACVVCIFLPLYLNNNTNYSCS